MKKFTLLLAFLSLTAVFSSAQDLGSSNKLFGGGASKKTVKKAPAKPKPAASKPKAAKAVAKKPSTVKTTPSKKNAASKTVKTVPSANKPVTGSAKPKFTEFQDVLPAPITITTSQPKTSPIVADTTANDLFEDLIEQGNVSRDDRNYPDAEAAYKRAKTVKPRDSRAVYGLGTLYADQQRWEDAENAYRTALQLDSGSATALIALSYVLTQPLSVINLSDRYEEAERLARRAIQQAPANALAFDQLGVALELRGLIGEETENAYRKAIQLDSAFAPAYAHLGRLLRRRGFARESAAAYQNAVDRSTEVATMVVVADIMQSEQRFPESEKLLRKAVEKDPKNQTAMLLLGRALTTMNDFAGAEKILKTSLVGNPNSFMANSLLGSLFVRQGKFELAENALLQALRSVSSLEKRRLSQQFESVGDGYLKSGNARNAERTYRQAISLDAENQSLAGKLAKAGRG